MGKASASHSLPSGFQLRSKDRVYEIVKVLGSGSFGITYLATGKISIGNITATVKFAIKEHFVSSSCFRGEDGVSVNTVPTAKSEVAGSRADFITEANRLKRMCLKSRGIVSVNETFEANGTAYYVMEFLDGGSLSKCSENEAVAIILQVANALNQIHEEHVLHLDLKPDNVVMKTDEKGETFPVLIDFGISKHFDSKGNPTSSIHAKGASPGYAPQEQYAGVNEFSPKYDIYALGALLFYLVTGKNPPDAFKISPNQQELKNLLDGKVSAKVEKTILNAMRPNASERTGTIRQFCDDLMGRDFVPVLSCKSLSLHFKKEKGTQAVSVESNINWNVRADEDWCKAVGKGSEVIVSVLKNKEGGSRKCNVIIAGTAYDVKQVISIRQEGVGTKPITPGPRPWEKWWETNRSKAYMAMVALAGIGLVIGIVSLFRTGSHIEPQVEAEKTASDEELRASLMPEDEVVEVVAESPVVSKEPASTVTGTNETNDEKFARAANNFNLMLSLAKEGYTKAYYPLAKMYYDRGDDANARAWAQKSINANINKSASQTLIARIANASEKTETPKAEASLDEQFRNAKTISDYKALAEKGYAKAYAPLAELYLKSYDYDNANRWAIKAGNANADLARARSVVDKLDILGYYHDKNNTKPNF